MGLLEIALALYNKGNYAMAPGFALQKLRLLENDKNAPEMTFTYNTIANVYKGRLSYPGAIYYYNRGKQMAQTYNGPADLTYASICSINT